MRDWIYVMKEHGTGLCAIHSQRNDGTLFMVK